MDLTLGLSTIFKSWSWYADTRLTNMSKKNSKFMTLSIIISFIENSVAKASEYGEYTHVISTSLSRAVNEVMIILTW